MDMALFTKCLDFCEQGDGFNVTVSGGEPTLHPLLVDFLELLAKRRCGEVVMTTNGTLVSDEMLSRLKRIKLPQITVQISLDSPDEEAHDKFRGVKGSFKKTTNTISRVRKAGLFPSMRCTFTPDNVDRAEEMVKLAIDLGSRRIGLGSVVPTGAAKDNHTLIFSPEKKKKLLESMLQLREKYRDSIEVVSGDPLKFCLEKSSWYKDNISRKDEVGYFGGCEAGVSGINVDSDGNVTPCALLKIPIVNLAGMSVKEAQQKYCESEIIKNLFDRSYHGKCGSCDLKRLCGGCRAIPEGLSGDYLGEDPTCFRGI
jgi:radical SAM protein with 4Fe4S-binding SPASM domain